MRQIPYSHSTKSSQMPEVGWPVVGRRGHRNVFVSILTIPSHFIIHGSASVYCHDIFDQLEPSQSEVSMWFLSRCIRFLKGFLKVFIRNKFIEVKFMQYARALDSRTRTKSRTGRRTSQ